MIFLDFETRSRVNLKTRGAYYYWRDLSSEVILIGWQGDEMERPLAVRQEDLALDSRLRERLARGETLVVHNAQFETLGYYHHLQLQFDWPPLKEVQDTAAMARAMSLPGHLDLLSKCLVSNLGGQPTGKDTEGYRIMLKFCKPDKDGEFYWNDCDYNLLTRYCKQDVALTKELYPFLRPLPPDELEQCELTEAMNARGVKLDMDLALQLTAMADAEKADIDERLREITGGKIQGATRVADIKEWLKAQTGNEFVTIGVSTLYQHLEDEKLDPVVREVMELRILGAKTSTSKIQRMIDAADPHDKRLRGMFLFNGAGTTGRWSSKIVQLHNLPRAGYGDATQDVIDVIKQHGADGLRLLYPNVMDELPKLIRSLLIAEHGRKFIAGDFAGIEARMLAFLSGADNKLKMYRNGEDTYLAAAEDIGYPGERQMGKTVELALGFAGGSGALESMGAKFGVRLEKVDQKRIVKKWREANKEIKQFWSDLEHAAMQAMRHPESWYRAGRNNAIGYYFDKYHLWCELPSGRKLCSPFARLEDVETPYGTETTISIVKGNRLPRKGDTDWPRATLWQGVYCENVIQAASADLLRWAVRRLDRAGYRVVLHVHDEFVTEVEEYVPIGSIEKCLAQLPAWAKGLPFNIAYWEDSRYRK